MKSAARLITHMPVLAALMLWLSPPVLMYAQTPACAYCGKQGCRNECISGGGSSGSHKSSSKTATQQAVVDAFGQALWNTLNDQPDKTKQEAARQVELQRQQEAARIKAAQEAAARQSFAGHLQAGMKDREARQAQGADLLQQMASGDGGGGQVHTAFMGSETTKPTFEGLLMPAGSVTAPQGAMGQLRAATGFSQAAANTGNLDQAAFLASQAGQVMPGGSTSLAAPAPVLPSIPPPSPPVRVEELKSKISLDEDRLQKLVAQLNALDAKKKSVAASHKKIADMRLQADGLRVASDPQDKARADELAAAAQALENDVNNQLVDVEKATSDINGQLDKAKAELQSDRAELQRSSQNKNP
jgi:hypothetical protein